MGFVWLGGSDTYGTMEQLILVTTLLDIDYFLTMFYLPQLHSYSSTRRVSPLLLLLLWDWTNHILLSDRPLSLRRYLRRRFHFHLNTCTDSHQHLN
jgi:hypothetical protein